MYSSVVSADSKLAVNYGYSGKDGVERFLREMHDIEYNDLIAKGKKELETFVNNHKPKKKRKKSTRHRSGGDDVSGSGKHAKGGFGEPPKTKN